MNMTIERLAELVGCHFSTVRMYLDRAEFRHITGIFRKTPRKKTYCNITNADIIRLKAIFEGRNRR